MTRLLLSQGEVRPGVVQGQLWRTTKPMKRYIEGSDGERITLHVNAWETIDSVRPTPRSHADPHLANRIER